MHPHIGALPAALSGAIAFQLVRFHAIHLSSTARVDLLHARPLEGCVADSTLKHSPRLSYQSGSCAMARVNGRTVTA